MTSWPVLTTSIPSLTLREYHSSDAPALFALESHPENARYQTWAPWTMEEAQRRLNDALLSAAQPSCEREVTELAVVFEGALVGRVGGRVPTRDEGEGVEEGVEEAQRGEKSQPKRGGAKKHVDLWFSLLPEMQRRGFATAAMRAFIAELVRVEQDLAEQGMQEDQSDDDTRSADLGLELELEIECDPRNEGSCKMAKRLGFVKYSEVESAFECKGEMVGSVVWRKVV